MGTNDFLGSGWTRRRWLQTLAAAAATSALSSLAAPAPGVTEMRFIPKTGEKLPAMGLGTSRTFDVGAGEAERAPVREVLKEFVALGGRVVDTSPMYGRAETVVGDLAAALGIHRSLFLATKVWTEEGRKAGIRQMETSFRRLHTDRLDLMQVHNLLDWATHLATLRAWKEQGRVRYLGITHYSSEAYPEMERIMRSEDIDFVQLNCSIVSREAEQRLLPLAQEQRIAVIANSPFERGALFDKVKNKPLPEWAAEFDCMSWGQFFLKFILSHPAVTCIIPATNKVKHLMDNMGAGAGRLPDAVTREKMAQWVERL